MVTLLSRSWFNIRTNSFNLFIIRRFTSRNRKDDKTNAAYCMNLVRKYDYENYLSTLLLPKDARDSVFAIRAFNLEILKIKDIISQSETGEMRMQFWTDAINSIYKNEPPQQPIALELMKVGTFKRHISIATSYRLEQEIISNLEIVQYAKTVLAKDKNKLSKMWFNRLLNERKRRLDDSPYRNLEELETYSENTVSSLLYLVLESLGVRCSHADHAASHIGKAYGIIILLRAIPFHSKQKIVYLPHDMLIKHAVSYEDIIRGRTSQAVKDVIYEVASLSNSHLETARLLKSRIPKIASAGFLCSVICQRYLRDLQSADFDVFHPALQERTPLLPVHLLIQRFRYTY